MWKTVSSIRKDVSLASLVVSVSVDDRYFLAALMLTGIVKIETRRESSSSRERDVMNSISN